MFTSCSSLISAPTLPAPTLANYCYQYMFQNCSSLSYIKCLATNKSASYCTNNWVSNVSSSGTFVKSPNATWPTDVDGVPNNWTVTNDPNASVVA